MVCGAIQCEEVEQGLEVFLEMRRNGFVPNEFGLGSVMKACGNRGEGREFGLCVHCFALKIGTERNPFVGCSVLTFYAKLGDIGAAERVFESLEEVDVGCWNAMIGGYAHCGYGFEAIGTVSLMRRKGIFMDKYTLINVIQGCSLLGDLNFGRQIHGLIIRGELEFSAPVMNALMDMYFKNGGINSEALKTFYDMLQLGVEANEYTFSNVLETCSRSENQLMNRLIHGVAFKSGFASHGHVCSSLIKGYIKFGRLDDSLKVFNMLDRPDMAAWGTMISAFVHQGFDCEAIRSLNLLIEADEKPDEFILGSILSSCAGTVAYCQTKSVHSLIIKLGFEGHVFVASAVLDAYAKCGDIQSAKMAFNQSCKSNDVVIYNAMIIAYAHHGRVVEALDTYDKMKLANLQPSQATFVSVIAACGHIGHVEKGCHLFKSMNLYGMEPSPDIYGCLVDMLSRNGYLEDAKQIIETLPYPAWPAILRSLLSGCRMHGNRELGEWTAKKLLQLVPHNDAAHALLFKVYSELGNWEDATKAAYKTFSAYEATGQAIIYYLLMAGFLLALCRGVICANRKHVILVHSRMNASVDVGAAVMLSDALRIQSDDFCIVCLKEGVLKKVNELSVLCDSQVGLFLNFSGNGKLCKYCTEASKSVLT
ncbi:hypothetical protein OIU84_008563 [Salix udensis]|uniref:MADS-box domain-containing protein n=1 Tax=Salix udensis TaxID=889485 RepID=A0AAD6JPM3_9ROSI|nr:hypothetical protein OIU84_008563 [Salix udensis]